ncbi:MAG: PhoU domain-containing protein [Actinomycetota bacterium]
MQKSVAMMSDARHSFDLATLALLTDASAEAVAADIRETDQRINQTEQQLRSELMVHVAVKGATDIGSVLAFTLLLKKIERVGDQAKNILDLAENGVSLAGKPETDSLMEERQILSAYFAEAGELLTSADPSSEALDDYGDRVTATMASYQSAIDGYMSSERPGHEVVPLAIYYRYLRRIAANLLGVVRTSAESVPHIDYLDDGTVDTDD